MIVSVYCCLHTYVRFCCDVRESGNKVSVARVHPSPQDTDFVQQNRNFFYQMPFPVYFVGRSFRSVAYTHEDFARFKYSDRHSYVHIIDTQVKIAVHLCVLL